MLNAGWRELRVSTTTAIVSVDVAIGTYAMCVVHSARRERATATIGLSSFGISSVAPSVCRPSGPL
jgi:hypothetical protein